MCSPHAAQPVGTSVQRAYVDRRACKRRHSCSVTDGLVLRAFFSGIHCSVLCRGLSAPRVTVRCKSAHAGSMAIWTCLSTCQGLLAHQRTGRARLYMCVSVVAACDNHQCPGALKQAVACFDSFMRCLTRDHLTATSALCHVWDALTQAIGMQV